LPPCLTGPQALQELRRGKWAPPVLAVPCIPIKQPLWHRAFDPVPRPVPSRPLSATLRTRRGIVMFIAAILPPTRRSVFSAQADDLRPPLGYKKGRSALHRRLSGAVTRAFIASEPPRAPNVLMHFAQAVPLLALASWGLRRILMMGVDLKPCALVWRSPRCGLALFCSRARFRVSRRSVPKTSRWRG